MRLEHHLVGRYVRYISPHIIIIKKEFDIGFVTAKVCDRELQVLWLDHSLTQGPPFLQPPLLD